MLLHYFFKKENKEKKLAENIYSLIISKSQEIMNNNTFLLQKNFQTSFEIITFFIICYLKVFKIKKIINYKIINQNIINLFISDLDKGLRDIGIGDMSLGKHVKAYVKKFYFRLPKIDIILDKNDNTQLCQYIKSLDIIDDSNINLIVEYLLANYMEIMRSNIKYNF